MFVGLLHVSQLVYLSAYPDFRFVCFRCTFNSHIALAHLLTKPCLATWPLPETPALNLSSSEIATDPGALSWEPHVIPMANLEVIPLHF